EEPSMRKRVALAVAGLAAAAAASVLAVTFAAAGGASQPQLGRWGQGLPVTPGTAPENTTLGGTGQIITLFEDETQGKSQVIDVGPSGPSPGDYVVFRDPLYYDQAEQQKAGNMTVQCTDLFAVDLCHGNAELASRGK